MASSLDLGALMQQLGERKRRDAALEAYRQETDPAAAKQKRDAALRRMLKDEPAPEEPARQPQYIAEPTITPTGAQYNAHRQALYNTYSGFWY